MHRLQVILIYSSILFMFGCGASNSGIYKREMYYLNGIDSRDGMSANINLKDNVIRISGEVFDLKKCGDMIPSSQCIKSNYFVFGYDGSLINDWIFDNIEFNISKRCALSGVDEINSWVLVIDSNQSYGEFQFYIKPNGEMIGWRLAHQEGIDFYLKQGFSIKECQKFSQSELLFESSSSAADTSVAFPPARVTPA